MTPAKPIAMSELIDRFASYLADDRKRRPRTVTEYVAVIKDFDAFLTTHLADGPVALEAVSKQDMQGFLRQKQSR